MQSVDLACGVAGEREWQVRTGNSCPIVRHADLFYPPLSKLHHDLAGVGVDAVFQHLLQGGGGTLHDLPGRNLADEQIGEKLDSVHEQDAGQK